MADSVIDSKNVTAAAEEVCEISPEKKTVVEPVVEKVAAAGADDVAEAAEVIVTEPVEDAEKAKDDVVVVEEVAAAAAAVVEDGVSETDGCKLKEKTTNGSLKNGLSKAVVADAAEKHDDENGDSQDDLIHEIKVTDVSGEDNSNDVCSLKRKSLTGDVPAEKKRKTSDENDHESVVVEVKNGSEKVA